jgi:multicomponent Na+:H+ antiporter subunit B
VSRRARLVLFAISAIGAAGLMAWAFAGLPEFGDYQGRYGRIVADSAVPDRSATSTVAVTVFDYRALDTLGEEFILFVSVFGVLALLRTQRDEEERDRPVGDDRGGPGPSESLRLVGRLLVPPVLLLGIYVVGHGHLTPGGGFQGGVVLGTAIFLLFLSAGYVAFRRVRPVSVVEATEAAGAAGFALIGVGGLLLGAVFFENFISPGKSGLLTGGTIPLSNAAVGLEVAGALIMILSEFLDQRLVVRERRR